MAKVSGAAGYQQLKPSNDGLSQGAQYWGGVGINMAQQNQRLKQRDKEMEAARKAAAQKEFESKFAKSNEALQLFDTKVGDLNTVIAKGVFRLKDENAKAWAVLDPSNTSATPMERMEARLKIQKIQEAIPLMRSATQSVTSHFEHFDKEVQEGKRLADPAYMKFRENAYDFGSDNKYVEVAFDDDMNLYLLNRDDENNITETSLADLVSGNIPQPMAYVNYGETTKFYKDAVKTFLNERTEGFSTITEKGISESSDAMLREAAEQMYSVDENGLGTPELYSYIKDRGFDPFAFSPEQLNDFAGKLQEKFLQETSQVDEISKNIYNHSAATQRERLALDRQKAAEKGGSTGLTFAIDPEDDRIIERTITDENGNNITAYAVTNNDAGKPFVLNKTKQSETRTDNIYITSDGKIYGDVYKVEAGSSMAIGASTVDDTREIVGDPESRWLSKTEANSIAVERGYKNAREMYVELDNERRGRSESSQPDEPIKFN